MRNVDDPKNANPTKSPAFRIPWPSFERLSGAMKFLYQVTAGVGGILLLIYCVEIGHFPAGATLADVLLLLAMAVAPTAIYSMIVVVLYGAGLALALGFRLLFNSILRRAHAKQQKSGKTDPNNSARQIPQFDASEWVLALCGLLVSTLLAFFFWMKDPPALITLGGYIVIIAVLRLGYAIRKQTGTHRRRSNRDFAILLGAAIYIFPLVTGLIHPLNLLPSSVRLIGARKESATLFIANSRAVLIDAELKAAKPSDTFGDYRRYENAIVLIRGIGTESVVEIAGRRWVIPNDQLVISYKTKP